MSENFHERLRELPGYLSSHLMLTVIALSVGVLISVPLAVWLTRRRRMQYPILTAAGVIQTIPSLALLALMVPLLAAMSYACGWIMLRLRGQPIPPAAGDIYAFSTIGFWPAIIALTLYSILPILRNTVTGIMGVDPAMIEAACGMGMTDRQRLWRVELPLAAPVILAGIRTAAVWVVGIATLSTPVGQPSLGNYIFTGLNTGNTLMILFGVAGASLLAIILDLLLGAVQRAADQRRRTLGLAAAIALAAVIVVGLISPRMLAWARVSDNPQGAIVHVGAKDFGEQRILGRMLVRALEDQGLHARLIDGLGTTLVFDYLTSGQLDLYVEYTGTVWTTFMRRDGSAEPDALLREMNEWLAQAHGIRNLGPLGFENAYALAMRRDTAERHDIRTIADLTRHTPQFRIAGSYEFFGRPEWIAIRDTYNLQFAELVTMDPTLMYAAAAQGEVDIIAAFSSDGRIAAYDLAVLDDPKQAIPPYDAVILLGPSLAGREDVVNALQPLLKAIDDDLMRQANRRVDRDHDKWSLERTAAWLWDQARRPSPARVR